MINLKDNSELLFIQEGCFFMGNNKDELKKTLSNFNVPDSEIHHFFDETPQRKILLKNYWISKHAITNGQFAKFI
jgi:formylglycine-generating enzyme required for sulfatase activity